MVVYKITNLVNNKIYIGQTISSIKERWSNHKSSNNCKYLSNAIKKYGPNNFTIEVLEECDTLIMLNDREAYYIEIYDSTNPNIGYNLRSGGENSLHSERSKDLMRKQRGPMSPEEREKRKGPKPSIEQERLRTIWVGKQHTEESRKKMSDSQKIAANRPERIEKLREANIGKVLSEETKIKISLAQIGKKRKPMSDETKRKIGEANKKRRANEEIITNRTEII